MCECPMCGEYMIVVRDIMTGEDELLCPECGYETEVDYKE